MWRFEQATGWLVDPSGMQLAQGYAGSLAGKNNPTLQHLHDVGPLPCGEYTIEAPVDTVTHGPYVLRLEPHADNNMFGRAGFLIHGDSVIHPGTASMGCIIMPRFARERVWESGDRKLAVV